MTHPKISVLVSILSWDSPRYLSNLLDNLDALPPSITGEIDTHLHILDQGSADETRDLVREFVGAGGSRTATFLARNVGFARGHNHVFDLVHRQQPFDYFVVLRTRTSCSGDPAGSTGWWTACGTKRSPSAARSLGNSAPIPGC